MKKTIEFMWQQPIYKTLQQMKVVSVIAITFTGYLMWDMWVWFKALETLPDGWSIAFFGYATTLVGAFWKAVNHLQQTSQDAN